MCFISEKKDKSIVNIFRRRIYNITLLAINVLQNLLFCIPKAAVLHGKSVGFAAQKEPLSQRQIEITIF